MTQQSWNTKEEILEDLALATGREVTRIDDNYLLCGEQPPPPLACDDDESQLEYHGVSKNKMLVDTPMEPDLEGIMQMIQMVNNFDNNQENKEKKTATNNVFVISKLNPDVAAFIPKTICKNMLESNDSSVNGTATIATSDTNTLNINNDSQTLSSQHKEREEMAKTLRMKINTAYQADTFQVKKEKNLAIASLLKLYTTKTTPKSNGNMIKLVTPDFFEKGISGNTELKKQIELKQQIPSSSSSDPNSNSIINKDISHKSEVMTETTLKKNYAPLDVSDIEIKNSIKKVNNWLNKPTATKAPVYLGQVAFKRKDPAISKSPNGTVIKVAKPTTDQCVMYKPSKYAENLGKIYLERNKLKESLEQDLWSKLSRDLKARDELIKKRILDKEVGAQEESETLAESPNQTPTSDQQ